MGVDRGRALKGRTRGEKWLVFGFVVVGVCSRVGLALGCLGVFVLGAWLSRGGVLDKDLTRSFWGCLVLVFSWVFAPFAYVKYSIYFM